MTIGQHNWARFAAWMAFMLSALLVFIWWVAALSGSFKVILWFSKYREHFFEMAVFHALLAATFIALLKVHGRDL